jgi:hypothetical protein
MRAVLLLIVLALVGCGEPRVRQNDDADGVPLVVVVRYDPAFVEAAGRGALVRTVVVSDPFWGPWHRPYGPGWHGAGWHGPPAAAAPSTTTWLLLGDGEGQAQALRAELRSGEQRFGMRLRAGRTLTGTVQFTGGLSGSQPLGTATVAAGQELRIDLDGVQPAFRMQPVP